MNLDPVLSENEFADRVSIEISIFYQLYPACQVDRNFMIFEMIFFRRPRNKYVLDSSLLHLLRLLNIRWIHV